MGGSTVAEAIGIAVVSGGFTLSGVMLQLRDSRRSRRQREAERMREELSAQPDRAYARLDALFNQVQEERNRLQVLYQASIDRNEQIEQENRTLRHKLDEARAAELDAKKERK